MMFLRESAEGNIEYLLHLKKKDGEEPAEDAALDVHTVVSEAHRELDK